MISLSEIIFTHPVFRARPAFFDFCERRIGIRMAGASAIAKLFHSVEGIGVNILLVFIVLEIGCVAGSAIRLVLR